MKFSTAALTFSFFAIVNSSVVTYSTEFGGNEEHKHDKYDCEIDTFDWKFALVVKEWKHHKDEKFCKDTDLDLVYEGDDGQLYHGCDGTYPYSKCKHCTNVFGGGDDDNKWDNKWKDDKGDDKWKDKNAMINGMTNTKMTIAKMITGKMVNAKMMINARTKM